MLIYFMMKDVMKTRVYQNKYQVQVRDLTEPALPT